MKRDALGKTTISGANHRLWSPSPNCFGAFTPKGNDVPIATE